MLLVLVLVLVLVVVVVLLHRRQRRLQPELAHSAHPLCSLLAEIPATRAAFAGPGPGRDVSILGRIDSGPRHHRQPGGLGGAVLRPGDASDRGYRPAGWGSSGSRRVLAGFSGCASTLLQVLKLRVEGGLPLCVRIPRRCRCCRHRRVRERMPRSLPHRLPSKHKRCCSC
jgi:hypothetical protein